TDRVPAAKHLDLDSRRRVDRLGGLPHQPVLAEDPQRPQASRDAASADDVGQQPRNGRTAAEAEDEDAIAGPVDAYDIQVGSLHDRVGAHAKGAAEHLTDLAVLHRIADAVIIKANL